MLKSNGRGHPEITVIVMGLTEEFVRTLGEFEELRVEQGCEEQEKMLSYDSSSSRSVMLVSEAFVQKVGNDLLNKLMRDAVFMKVLVIGKTTASAAHDLLNRGCAGLLDESAPAEDVRRAIHAVSRGELWFSRQVLSAVIRSRQISTMTEKGLTSREREILRLIGQGYNNQEIASALFISRETVRWHMRSLYSKLGMHDRKRATVLALASLEQRYVS